MLLAAGAVALGMGGLALRAEGERTLYEIKEEAIARVDRGGHPLIGLDPADVREAFQHIRTRDGDEWAAAWIAIGDRYRARAEEEAASNPLAAEANYLKAWRLYSFGRWPVPSSPGKERAYARALEAFLAAARTFTPPLEVVRLPFEGSEIVAYLRLPKASGRVPVVLAISGLDSRKEDLVQSFAAILPHGIGVIAVDGPGTGQAPTKASESAERMFARLIDHLLTRAEIDNKRILVHGVSFGGYWSAKLAITERARIKAASAQSPAVHEAFQAAFVEKKVTGNREYLFDYAPAMMSIFDGVKSLDELKAAFPRLSLAAQGLLAKPAAPMLIIAGARDTQVPIADAYLLLASGDRPKEAWINPHGGHLGREPGVWPDPVIFAKVLIPWIVRAAEGNGS